MADPALRLAPLICFEDTLAPLVREPVLRGAQLLVNITNDAWFRHTAASRQQLAEATFRTVENRRPLVRCANTGVTAFLDADGRITQILRSPGGSIFEPGVLAGVVKVPVDRALTFYTRHGDVFSVACALAAGLAAFLRRMAAAAAAGTAASREERAPTPWKRRSADRPMSRARSLVVSLHDVSPRTRTFSRR